MVVDDRQSAAHQFHSAHSFWSNRIAFPSLSTFFKNIKTYQYNTIGYIRYHRKPCRHSLPTLTNDVIRCVYDGYRNSDFEKISKTFSTVEDCLIIHFVYFSITFILFDSDKTDPMGCSCTGTPFALYACSFGSIFIGVGSCHDISLIWKHSWDNQT